MDFLVFFRLQQMEFFLGAKQNKSKFGTIFQTSRFLVLFVAVSSLDFRGKFWGVLFLVFPCESWCARVSEEIFRISDPAAPNDEILHDLFGLLIYGYLEGVYTQYIAYHRSSFMNEYSITNPDTKLH